MSKLCQWPDDDDMPCGKPVAKKMMRYGDDGGRPEVFVYCYRHMRPPRQKRVEAAGWLVVAA